MKSETAALLAADPIAAMVMIETWLAELDFDDHADQALAIANDDDLEQHRLDRAIARHPAGTKR